MFAERELSDELEGVRDAQAPDAIVLDVEADFEILDPDTAETLGLLVESLSPLSYPSEWIPTDAPCPLHRLASETFTIGAPGDGSVTWTRQTNPPVLLVKPRLEGSLDGFAEFLVAEGLVEIGCGLPEQFLEFFGDQYHELATTSPLSPAGTYQLAVALFGAFTGLHTRNVFEDWVDRRPWLYDQWLDAGQRLKPRLDNLPRNVAIGRTNFEDAAEFACSAIKHGLDLPPPFAALDTIAYPEHGAEYAVQWADKTFDRLN